MPRRFLLLFFLLLLPAGAGAVRISPWDFRENNIPGDWQMAKTLSVTPSPEGLRVRTAGDDGYMIRTTDAKHRTELLRLITTAEKDTDVILLFHRLKTPPQDILQLPIRIPAGKDVTTDTDLSVYPEWDGWPDGVGLAFRKGTELTLVQLQFVGFTPVEKLVNAWHSFWTFDSFTASAINFLWGPVIRFTPVTQESLFAIAPPQGWSANRFFYAILGGAGAVLLWLYLRRGRYDKAFARRLLLTFCLLSAALWLFYDLRMSAEYVSYALTDVRDYLTRPLGQRRYRAFNNYYDAIEQSAPILMLQPVYGFLYPSGTPLPTRIQYRTYPSIPAPNPASGSGITTWFVFGRPDVTVDAEGTLRAGETVLARGGKILRTFDDSSFLYGTP